MAPAGGGGGGGGGVAGWEGPYVKSNQGEGLHSFSN